MAGKIKADPKQLLVNHGEKIGFGIVLILVVLGLVGTDWVPYERNPGEITEKVEAAETALASANWQQDEQLADERAKYQLEEADRPENVVLASLSRDIQVTPFRPSQRLTKTIVDVDRPLTEPNFLPVEQMIASAARVYLELPPEDLAATGEDGEEGQPGETAEEAIDDEDLPDELRERRGGSGSAMAGYDGLAGYGDAPDYESMYAPELEMEEYYSAMGSEMDGGEYDLYGGGATSNRRGRGYPFVSVRGVYPFKNQIYEFKEATHQTFSNAARDFQIIDFELQRQELAIGSSEWSDWEQVDINVLRDVIDSTAGMEPDVVNTAVTDAVITCPLPMRVTGVWDRQATHPRLQDFVLSDADIEREMQFNRALLKQFMDEQAQLPKTEVTPRGFSDMIFDARSLQAGLMDAESAYDMSEMYDDGEYESMMSGYDAGGYGGFGASRRGINAERANPELEKFAQELAKQFDTDSMDLAERELESWIVERATAEGELLLYRYLDFDVKPGYTYRYRVRLELKNPNFGAPITAVGGVAHVREGETRFTPWSEPTEPVRVDETMQYFLADVDQNRGSSFPETEMKVFQWDTELGTVVHDDLTVQLGQEIGGEEKVDQINAAKQTYEEADYTFTSNDRLVDAITDVQVDRNEHPDLALPQGSLGVAHTVEYALVAQDERALVALDPRTQASALKKQEKYIERQEELYGAYKDRAAGADPNSEEYDLMQQLYGSYEGAMPEGYDEYGTGRRGRNSLRRGGGRGMGN